MKARKIFETIDFVRGQDSKRSLRVGEANHPLYEYWIAAKESPNFETVSAINPDHKSNDYYFEIYSKLESSNEEFHGGEKDMFTLYYHPETHEFTLVYDNNGNDWIIGSLKEFKIITRSEVTITESIDFKRGQTSKKALRVGKYRYPEWTKPEHLDKSDHNDLKSIWDHIQDGNLDKAREISDHVDTIVRDEIPPKIWYDVLNPELKPLRPYK